MPSILIKTISGKLPVYPSKDIFAYLLIIFSVLAVYSGSIRAPFIYDDYASIVDNRDIRDFNALSSRLVYPYKKNIINFSRNIPTRPLTYFTFALNYKFSKLNTFMYHTTNLILHLFVTILLFRIFRAVFAALFSEQSILFPLAAALMFALHPVNTEAVIVIGRRATLLFSLFYLAALYSFTLARRGNRLHALLSPLFFSLSILSKETAITFPFIVLLFDYFYCSKKKFSLLSKRSYLHIIYWGIAFLFIVFKLALTGGLGHTVFNPYLNWSAFSYFITQFYVQLKYMSMYLFPVSISLDHFVKPVHISSYKFFIPALLYAFIATCLYTLKNRTYIYKAVFPALAWYIITITPTSSFLVLMIPMADRRLYLPGISLILIILFLYRSTYKYLSEKSPDIKYLVIFFLAVHLLCFVFLSIKRNLVFNEPAQVWNNVLAQYPDNFRAHNNLGLLYLDHGDLKKAEQHFRESIQYAPSYADAYLNLGVVLSSMSYDHEAFSCYRKALSLNPQHPKAYFNTGNYFRSRHMYDKAAYMYRKALELNPYLKDAELNLMTLYLLTDREQPAEKTFTSLRSKYPEDTGALYNMALYFYKKGAYDRAERLLEDILVLDPEDRAAAGLKEKIH